MELHRVEIVFIVGVIMGLFGSISSLCLIRDTSEPKVFWYQCFMSNDYLEDVQKAPIDIPKLTFSNSKINVVKNGSFNRLNKHLERIAFFYCDVDEIEDNAFEGLTKLDLLAVIGSKLEIIKSAWFVGLSNLKVVSFLDNRIKHVEDNFFSILPSLEILDISVNEITCLSTDSFGNFHADAFNFQHNHLTWKCQALLLNWLSDKKIRYDFPELENIHIPHDLTKICIKKSPTAELDEKFLNNCIEETANDFLPAQGNYTVKQMCELLEDKSTPFLDCTN